MNSGQIYDGRMLPDEAARRAIREELDANILTEAGAGTGKTSCLVARMVGLVREGRCDVGTMAAVTFTRKAAAELRARFQVELEKARSEESDVARLKLIDRALSSLERCFLGTIHSFCGRLLRERPVEAGVDPAFEELDETADEELREEAWELWVAQLIGGNDTRVLEALDRLALSPADLKHSFLRYADYPDVDEWPLPQDRSTSAIEARIEDVLKYAEHIQGLCRRYPEPTSEGMDFPDGFRRMERLLYQARRAGSEREIRYIVQLVEAAPPRIVQKYWPGGKSEGKQESDRLKDFIADARQPILDRWHELRYAVIMEYYAAARVIYDRMRAERGGLNYQDLLIKSAALLRDKPHVRAYFRRRFTHILVDEFQDTDPIQAEVLFLLTAADPNQTDWRRCRPGPGSLFVVGDPKQSIYRFRRADIRVYNEVRSLLEQSGGRVIELVSNFRTTGSVIDWLNGCFQSAAHGFPEKANAESPACVALRKGRVEASAGELCGLRVLRVPQALTKNEQVVPYDADRVARIIRNALDQRLRLPRSEQEAEEGKPPEVQPGDFMILTWNKKQLAGYAQALQQYGIPHQVTGSTSLCEIAQLQALRSCLAAAIEPENPVALLAVLRGELFGFSDPELFRFRQAGGTFNYRLPIPESLPEVERERFRDAFQRLSAYASWLDSLPLAAALEGILNDLGLLAVTVSASGGNVQAGSLLKAIELLRRRCTETWSRKEALDLLDELLAGSKEQDGLPAAADDQPVVRVMNLHKAKGLEAPVVFLANPSGYRSASKIEIHVARQEDRIRGYLNIQQIQDRGDFESRSCLAHPETTVWSEVSSLEERFLKAEELRLRYVAATRAGALLVISRRDNRNQSNPWSFFDEKLAGIQDAADPAASEAAARAAARLDPPTVAEELRQLEMRRCAAISPTYGGQPARAFAAALYPAGPGMAPASISATGFAASTAEGERGVEWGRVVHSLLELAMNRPAADLRKTAEVLLREEELDPSHAASAVDLVHQVMESELWKRALCARRHMTEVPFTVQEESLEPGHAPVLVRGVIDLLFEEEDGWVLVDYKTDAVNASQIAALVEKHSPQVRYYARTFSRLTQLPIKESFLYFTHPALSIPVL